MISVIMTWYNTAYHLLKRAIMSVLNQTYQDFEFILINDGSDNYHPLTGKMIIDFQEEFQGRMRVVDNLINIGQGESRNRGIQLAQGDYIFFIDSDDYIYDDALETLYNNLISESADISIGNFTRKKYREMSGIRTYTREQALAVLCNYPDNEFLGRMIPQVAFNTLWNKVYKREVFEGVKFVSGHPHDDTLVSHQILWNVDKVVFTNKLTYLYRPGGNFAGEHLYENKELIFAHDNRLQFLRDVIGKREYIEDEKAWYLRTLYLTHQKTHDDTLLDKVDDFIVANPGVYERIKRNDIILR